MSFGGRMIVPGVGLCLAAFSAGAAASFDPDETQWAQATVVGEIKDPTGTALAGAVVSIVDWSGFETVTTTDAQGEFHLALPFAGEFLLRLKSQCCLDFTLSLHLEVGGIQTVTIEMIAAAAGPRNEAIEAYNAGLAATGSGDLDLATRHLVAATAADPSLAEPFLALANIYSKQGPDARAAAAARSFLELKPGSRRAQLIAYEAYRKLGNQAGVDELRQLLSDTELAPRLAIQAFNEGALASQKGDLEAAVAGFLAASSLDPELGQAHAALALLYHELDRYQEASEAAGRAVALRPADAASHRVRFEALEALGQAALENEALALYIAADPAGAVSALMVTAELDFLDGAMDGAEATLRRVVEIAPRTSRAHYLLGRVLETSDEERARRHLERFIALAPEDPNVQEARALLDRLASPDR